MNFNPKITIIIPVYNGSNFIKKAIESAINQTYKNIEIIVVNDGSTDNGKTEKIVKTFDDKIKYINKKNGGVASALNEGIKNATGDYISWLSHDDEYLPQKIEKQIDVINNLADKNTIIFSNFELINEKDQKITTTNFTKNISKEKLCQGIYPILKGCVNGCSTLIAKKCFEEIGYFREDLKTTNDYEMWTRLFNKFQSYFIEEPLIRYRIHENQDTNKNPAYITESNELWKNIINSLTKEQIESWNLEEFNVYMTLYIQMKNSKFNEAADIAYKKAQEIYLKNVPKISIAMPCYNASKYIFTAIKSILEQSYCNFELLVVDDNSEDETLSLVQEYSKHDFRIKVLNNEFEKGVSGAMNTAIKYARGKYFTRMDSDDISIIDRLEKQINFLEEHKEYKVCSVNISMIDEFNNVYNDSVYPDSKIPHEWTFMWTNPIPNAPCMYLFEIIKDNNLQFSNLKTAEDYEFLSHIITKTKVYMINEPLYYYRHTSNSLFNGNIKETFRNSLDISKKYFKEVTQNQIPPYYDNLTYFMNEDCEIINEDIKVVNRFLMDTANRYKNYFNWTEEEYNLVIDSIPEILERYVILKTGIKQFEPTAQNQASKLSSIKRLIKKVIKYLKENGLKKTIKAIINKIIT